MIIFILVKHAYSTDSFIFEGSISWPNPLIFKVPNSRNFQSRPQKHPCISISAFDIDLNTNNLNISVSQKQRFVAWVNFEIKGETGGRLITLRIQYLLISYLINFEIATSYVSTKGHNLNCPDEFLGEVAYSGLNLKNVQSGQQYSILLFVTELNITISDTQNCIDFALQAEPRDFQKYRIRSFCSCHTQRTTHIGFSQLIFNQTKIQLQGKVILNFGNVESTDSNFAPLVINLPFYFQDGYIMGISQYSVRYNSHIGSILMNLNYTMSQTDETVFTLFQQKNGGFLKLSYNYWAVSKWICPQEYPFYYSKQKRCYDNCPSNTFLNYSSKICFECFMDTNYHQIVNGTCKLKQQYFWKNNQTIQLCSDFFQDQCQKCQSETTCIKCKQNKIFVANLKSCENCGDVIDECIECESDGQCTKCDDTRKYFLGNNNTCIFCDITNQFFYVSAQKECKACSQLFTNCLQCNTDGSLCLQCADSYFWDSLQCKKCSEEINGCVQCHKLTTGVECTQCDTSNHFVLSLSQCVLCPPNIAFFDSVSSQCVSCEDKFGGQCAQCTQNECEECENGFFAKNGDCALCTNGCELCHSETLCLRCSDRWTLREDGSCRREDECADCECLSEKKTNDANALQMYLDKQCHKMKQISDFVFSIKMLSVLSVLLSVVGNRIIGVKMMGVLQLAHLVLAHYGDPQNSPIGLTEISTWRWAHGGWIQRLPPQNDNKDDDGGKDDDRDKDKEDSDVTNVINVPNARILGILFTASFFWDNIVMIAVTLAVALLALILVCVLQKKKRCPAVCRIAKEIFLSLVLFDSLSFSFTFGLALLSSPSLPDIVCMVLCVLLFVGVWSHLLHHEGSGWGQYSDLFKDTFTARIYVPLTLVYRVTMGVSLAVPPIEEPSLWCIAVCSLFVAYHCVNLPFKKSYHNYRASVMHIAHLVILLVWFSGETQSIKTNLSELIVIFLCVVLSLCVIIYEIVQWGRHWVNRKSSKVIQMFQNKQDIQRAKKIETQQQPNQQVLQTEGQSFVVLNNVQYTEPSIVQFDDNQINHKVVIKNNVT